MLQTNAKRRALMLWLVSLLISCGSQLKADQILVLVDSKSDLSNAGRTVLSTPFPPVNVLFPVEIELSANKDFVRFPSVVGSLSAGPGWPTVGPDGGTVGPGETFGTNILSFNGISGILANRFQFLAGVFLDDAEPVEGQQPDRLDFRAFGTDFATLSPLMHQSFFIGDGRTHLGDIQQFNVPDGATRLFLGFLDSDRFGWPQGGTLPYAYHDNTGALTVTVSAVPEPNILLLGYIAAPTFLAFRRQRRASLGI